MDLCRYVMDATKICHNYFQEVLFEFLVILKLGEDPIPPNIKKV